MASLIHPFDPEAIAQSVEELATDAERTMKMGAAARQVAARFAWSAILEQFARDAEILK